jgi:hypothetical protein
LRIDDEESIQPCPVVVKRVAGLPVRTLESNGSTQSALASLTATEKRAVDAARSAITAIEDELPNLYLESRLAANAALALKRALYNRKQPRKKDVESACEILRSDTATKVNLALLASEEITRARNDYAAAYQSELDEISFKAVNALCREDLAAAMRNSNPELAARIDGVRRRPNEMKAKDLTNAKIGAVRQAARISLKTSPFGVYGEVEIGGWSNDRDSATALTKRIRNQPNYGPLGHVVESLSTDFDKLSDQAPLRLNSSLTIEQDTLKWRKVENGSPSFRVRHISLTESTTKSLALKAVVSVMTPGNKITKGNLLAALHRLLSRHEITDVAKLARHALASQLIVCGAAYGQRPLLAARSIAEALDRRLADEFRANLDRIVEAASRGDCERTTKLIGTLARVAGIEIKPHDVRPAIFQDAFTSGRAFAFDESPAFIEEVATAVRFAQALDQPGYIERARRHIAADFVKKHGEGGRAPAMTFLESYLSSLRQIAPGTFDLSDLEEDARRGIGATWISERLAEGNKERLHIETGFARAMINKQPKIRAMSQMCFMQQYCEEGEMRYALNRCHSGWASSFSRFIETDSWAIKPLRSYLQSVSEEGGAAEIIGWFGFNAADRPKILSREVFIPPIDDPDSGAKNIASYHLRHRREFDDLVFASADGEDVSLLFTAVLAANAMPRLHFLTRILGSYTESIVETWAPIVANVRRNVDGVKRCPRTDVGRITICRRQLLAPYVVVPGFDLDDIGYHRSFNEWMDREGMPRWIYVTAPDERSKNSEVNRRQKPMPVDRWNPAMVQAMRKEIAHTSGDIAFVEALPQPHSVNHRTNGEMTMVELGIEFAIKRRP